MESFLQLKILDNFVLYTFIISILSIFTLQIKTLINSNLKQTNNHKGKMMLLLYFIIMIFAIPLAISLITFYYLKPNPYTKSILGITIILFSIYYFYTSINTINKSKFENTHLSVQDSYNLVFSQLFYFVFFSKPIYSQWLNSFTLINNKFISESIILTYMLFKLIILLFSLITNSIFIAKNIYKLFFPNLRNNLLKVKQQINNFSIELTFSDNDLNISRTMCKTLESNFWDKINNMHIILKIPFVLLIYYIIEVIKFILVAILNIFIGPLELFKKILNNEFIFFYRCLRIIALISVSLIYIHILNHGNFNDNSVTLYEFFGITITIALSIQQLQDSKKQIQNNKLL